MRQVTSLHRTLVVFAVGLLALAAPLVAYADGSGPGPAARTIDVPTMRARLSAGHAMLRRVRRPTSECVRATSTSCPLPRKSSSAARYDARERIVGASGES